MGPTKKDKNQTIIQKVKHEIVYNVSCPLFFFGVQYFSNIILEIFGVINWDTINDISKLVATLIQMGYESFLAP